MARVKYYNAVTRKWEYADAAYGIKGDKGDPGEKGDPYTLTEKDKEEVVSEVLAALPAWTGGSY